MVALRRRLEKTVIPSWVPAEPEVNAGKHKRSAAGEKA
jgi:hypothetical protein